MSNAILQELYHNRPFIQALMREPHRSCRLLWMTQNPKKYQGCSTGKPTRGQQAGGVGCLLLSPSVLISQSKALHWSMEQWTPMEEDAMMSLEVKKISLQSTRILHIALDLAGASIQMASKINLLVYK